MSTGEPAERPYDAGVTGYDEFAYFRDNADEADLSWTGAPQVERLHHAAPSGHRVSALRWGAAPPEFVLLHGGGQNAHTWDTLALALDRPVLAVDLPGHGHSDWRDDHDYRPQTTAPDVAHTLEVHAPNSHTVAAMSLGGLTALALQLHGHPLPERLVLIDITPGVNHEKSSAIEAFLRGPETFASFDEILERTVLFNPTRSESSLRRGILHNARKRPDGRWEWRYDLPEQVPEDLAQFDPSELWAAVSDYPGRLFLARGGTSPVVDDDDVAELMRLRPDAHVEVFAEAGHSIQGDQPVELAEFLASLPTS